MHIKWFVRAQRHWDEQLDYCAETFGRKTALDSIRAVEDKIEWISQYPTAGTPEPLLKGEKHLYRFVFIQKRIKLIYRYDEQRQTIFIVDVWNTRMLPQHLLKRMK